MRRVDEAGGAHYGKRQWCMIMREKEVVFRIESFGPAGWCNGATIFPGSWDDEKGLFTAGLGSEKNWESGDLGRANRSWKVGG
jgi:hypothetical protein